MRFGIEDLERLERALGDRKLERLYVKGTRMTGAHRPRLAALCDGKVEVAFDSGARTFKADAPFLKRS
ncbi:MAG: hypothetical protein H0V17_30390 [Deltaproteobacteria bacterium]|nr:hypothetical protein [Deltaproteobacteria bacterium]